MDIPTPTSTRRAGLSMLLGGAAPADMVPTGPIAPDATTEDGARLLALRVTDVRRNEAQPRTHFDADAITSLAASIEANGIIQPIAVRPKAGGSGWEIVAGERRWLAAQQAGLTHVPAVVHDIDDRQTLVLALVENLVREDLSPLEAARAYAALQDEFGMTVTDLARSVGRSRPAVSNTIRLLELPDDVLAMLDAGQVTEGHGRALLGCSDRLRLQRLARLTLDRSLTVRALERMVREEEETAASGGTRATRRSKWNLEPAPELVERVEALGEQLLGVRVRIKLGEGGGKLELQCDTAGDLVGLVERLEGALTTA